MKLQNKRGFTLIELLVVITIIGILATGGTAVYTQQMGSARDSKRIMNVKTVQSTMENYMADNATYMTDTSNIAAVRTEVQKYTSDGTLPKDPLGTANTGNKCTIVTDATPSINTTCKLYYDTNATKDSYKVFAGVERLGTAANTKDGGSLTGAYEIWGGAGGQALTGTTAADNLIY